MSEVYVCKLCGETFPIDVRVIQIAAHLSSKHKLVFSLFFEKKTVVNQNIGEKIE
jgi:hypothetical protein